MFKFRQLAQNLSKGPRTYLRRSPGGFGKLGQANLSALIHFISHNTSPPFRSIEHFYLFSPVIRSVFPSFRYTVTYMVT